MGAVTAEEVASLQREFDWVLDTEVDNVTKQLKAAVTVSFNKNIHCSRHGVIFDLQECASKFPIKVGDLNSEKSDHPSSDKFVLSSGDQVKVIVTLTGDAISGADINLKLPRPHTKDAYHNTTVRYSFVIPPDSQFSLCKLFTMPGTTCRGSFSRCRTRLTTCSWCRSSSPRCRTSTCSGPRTRSITSSIT